ncbi:hypothetical protein BOTBODRAFT_511557 [Botryobasidium botryosum FD-172 SS1]|uniref:Uncharacterized protein n=1 Tax=Botryobasidium botryosum (strain FD-172 SS1) TaxID=930990 RepID=A0A067MUP3_BOTB1|nr:hypothetical protein BOTBODRAFT_511557 [Botryobasidium botryosum FD-172 SS1]
MYMIHVQTQLSTSVRWMVQVTRRVIHILVLLTTPSFIVTSMVRALLCSLDETILERIQKTRSQCLLNKGVVCFSTTQVLVTVALDRR